MLLWLFLASAVTAQNKDPFGEGIPDDKPGEMIYDFDDVHKWDDVIVKLNNKGNKNYVIWSSTHVASHRGVVGKKQTFSFNVDVKLYEAALQHPDLNRGMILMSGDLRFPSLHCWLRPFSIHKGKAYFIVSVPPSLLKEMHIAFISREGKKRYLYNLATVAVSLKDKKKRGSSPDRGPVRE
jgi:hypothetical protein